MLAQGETIEVNFPCTTIGTTIGTISGTVREEGTGRPEANIPIVVRETDGTEVASTSTAEDGSYSIDLRHGTYRVEADCPPLRSAANVVVQAMASTLVDFDCPPPTAVEGRVTLEGEGLAGILVEVDGATTRTDSAGEYRITGVQPGDRDVTISDIPGDVLCPITRVPVVVVLDGTVRADFECVRRGAVAGTVTLEGEPMAGILVTLGGRTARTDAGGGYAFAGVDPGTRDVTIGDIPADVVCPTTLMSVVVFAGQTSFADFQCLRRSSFQGIVEGTVSVEGDPLPGILVTLEGRTTSTDAGGAYRFEGVDAGARDVTISEIPGDVMCPVTSITVFVTAGQTVRADFLCVRGGLGAADLAGTWDSDFAFDAAASTCPGTPPDFSEIVQIVDLGGNRIEIRFANGTVVTGDYTPATGAFQGSSPGQPIAPDFDQRLEIQGTFRRNPDGRLAFQGQAAFIVRHTPSGNEECRTVFTLTATKIG